MPTSPQILDVTVRDGGYLINNQYSPPLVADIARSLSASGISWAEISHGMGIGGKMLGYPAIADDETLLEAAKEAAPELKLVAFISPVDFCLPLISGLAEFFEMGRIGTNVDQVETGAKFIQKLKKYGKKVSVQLVRTHAVSPESAAKAAKQAAELGADVIYVVDTFSSMKPEDVRNYVAAVKSAVPVDVGFHGHNSIGMAIPNTLAAWEAGATWLDASLMGVGRGAGNAPLETLVLLLQEKDELKNIELKKLSEASEKLILPLFQIPPYSAYLDLLFSRERLDYSPPDFLNLCAHVLGVSLEDLLTQLHAKMKTSAALTEAHVREVFRETGIDFDQMLVSLKPKEANG
jgi:4-hydroxy-2-oxovalerate aldolase